MKYKIGDYIKLKPDAEVSLSYKKGSPPQKLITNGIWRIDDIEELEDDIQSLYITIVSGNYNPGSFGSWVSNEDVLKLVNTTKENKTMKKSELITLIKESIQVYLTEVRSSDIEYQEKKVKGEIDRVTAKLTMQKGSGASRVAKRYLELENQIDKLAKERESLNPELKEYINEFFDIEDEIYTRVLDTSSFILTMSKKPKDTPETTISNTVIDYDKILSEIANIFPDLTESIKTITNQYTRIETQTIAAKQGKSPSVKVTTKEGIDEGVNHFIMQMKSYIIRLVRHVKSFITGKLEHYDDKLEDIKLMYEGT